MATISKLRIKGVDYDIVDSTANSEIGSIKDNFLSKLEAMGIYATKSDVDSTFVKKDDISFENNTLIINK